MSTLAPTTIHAANVSHGVLNGPTIPPPALPQGEA
jgi:hypothetical protein